MTANHEIAQPPEPTPERPRLVLLEAGPGLTLERVLAFGRKMLGREATAEELEYMRQRLAHLPPR